MKNGIRSTLSPLVMVSHATLSADPTPVEIDLQGFHACTIMLYVGAGGITFSGTNKIEFVLTHGSTSGELSSVDARDVGGLAAADLANGEITGGIIKTLNSAHATATFYQFDYVGKERYIELLPDFSGTHGTGTVIAAHALRLNPAHTSIVPEADIATGRAA